MWQRHLMYYSFDLYVDLLIIALQNMVTMTEWCLCKLNKILSTQLNHLEQRNIFPSPKCSD